MKTAIVLGATGLTGGILLKKLLEDELYGTIKIFSRRTVGIKNDKIREYILDLLELEKYGGNFDADEVYCCIGSTKEKTPDFEVYKKIDYGIPVMAAKLSKEKNTGTFIVISALGADPQSKIFYNRIKGEMERDVLKEHSNCYILKPSLIMGRRKEKRLLESFGKKLMTIGDHLLVGSLKRYKSIHAEEMADAMIHVAKKGYFKSRISSDEIRALATASKNHFHA